MKLIFLNRLLILGFLVGGMTSARAAQYGTVISPTANVLQFPQPNAKIVAQVRKDDQVTASNFPTENYFKVRLYDGTVGWISGNDLYVTQAPPSSSDSSTAAPEGSSTDSSSSFKEKPKTQGEFDEHVRIIFGIGQDSLSYLGMPQGFYASNLNYGWNGQVEFQFKWTHALFWALRLEYMTANSGNLNLGSGLTQNLSHKLYPVEVGLEFAPLAYRYFRMGLGLYGGASYSSFTITQTDSSGNVNSIGYPSIDPCATASIQIYIGFGRHTGLFLEGAYRYEHTSVFNASTLLGGVSSFAADYSGIVAHGGIEFRI